MRAGGHGTTADLADQVHALVYRPESETGNDVPSVLPRRYDAFLSVDVTEALRPLPGVRARDDQEVPDTFPTGV